MVIKIAKEVVGYHKTIWSFQWGRRIAAYIMLYLAFSAAIFGLYFCVMMVWAAINFDYTGFTPSDDWDLR